MPSTSKNVKKLPTLRREALNEAMVAGSNARQKEDLFEEGECADLKFSRRGRTKTVVIAMTEVYGHRENYVELSMNGIKKIEDICKRIRKEGALEL
jgi:hypothetical protein